MILLLFAVGNKGNNVFQPFFDVSLGYFLRINDIYVALIELWFFLQHKVTLFEYFLQI